MAGLSSNAAGTIQNKEKTFQGQRLDDDLGLNWVQFKWRNHDPQTGRFIEIDPLSEKYEYNSTYAFSENHVIAHVELEGLEKVAYKYVNAFLSPNVTQPLKEMAGNLDKAGSVKMGLVGGGFGFQAKAGKFDTNAGISGPQASTTLTSGGDINANGSVATFGAEGNFYGGHVGAGITFGTFEASKEKIESSYLASSAQGELKLSKEAGESKIAASSYGEFGFSATLGIVSVGAKVDAVKAVAATVKMFESLSNFVVEVAKESIPNFLGGNKKIDQ